MLRCSYGVGGGVMLTFTWSAYVVDATLHVWGGGWGPKWLSTDGGWSHGMEWSSERRKKTKKNQNSCYTCEAFSGRVYHKGGSATATKSFGRNSGVRQNLGFTQKNFASHFEYSTTRQLSLDATLLRLQRYVWMWYWRHRISSEGSDVLESLGALMSKVNDALGYWK